MAINQANPQNMIATANDMYYNNGYRGYRMSAWVTTDGGQTWQHTATPKNQGIWVNLPQGGGATNFDPGIVFDTQGYAYYSYGFTQTMHGGDDESDNGVFVVRSTDGGLTWEDTPYPVALETSGQISQPFHDRYTIAADISPESPYKDNVYLTWKKFKVDAAVLFSKSTDNGVSWSAHVRIPGGDGATQSPIPAVGPDGRIYVCFQKRTMQTNKTQALVSWSSNGGVSWYGPEKALDVFTIGEINTESYRNTFPTKQNMRVSSAPVIAVDNSNGPRKGWVYVAQCGKDAANGQTHLYLTKSTDNGTSWFEPIIIDNNEIGNDIFFPAIAVDPVTGMVGIMYYSSQNDPNNQGVDAYAAISRDGENFSVIRLTPETTYLDHISDVSIQGTGNFYWGDYTTVVAHNGVVYPCFWWPTEPGGSFESLDVFIAPLSDKPLPPQNVELVNQVDGQPNILLSWDDPETNMLNEPLPDFKIHIYREGEKLTEVERGVGEFLDATVTDGVVYQYTLKTVTIDNQESDNALASIRAGGEFLPHPPTNLSWLPAEGGVMLSWDNPSHRVDGSQFTDLARIDVYENDTKVYEVDHSIAAGQRSSVLIPLETKNYHHLKLKAVGSRGETEPVSVYSEEVHAFAGTPLTILDESFDELIALTPMYTGDWGITNVVSKSSPNSFTDSPDGDYESNVFNYMLFAPVVIQDGGTTLTFEHIALIRNQDLGKLDYSSDFGKTWEALRWYDASHSDKFGPDLASSEFIGENFGLSEHLGDTLIFRFGLHANFVGSDDGWYIDDVLLSDAPVKVDEEMLRSETRMTVYPNPASASAELTATLPRTGNISIALYDNLGHEV
ncbi:MAG: exo-alpha-sialidase, partial [Bacteroidota bacterium]